MIPSRPRNSIHIKNLPDTITYNDLWLEFSKHGEIVNVTIPVDIVTGKAKGYAFVDYQSPEDADKALVSFNGVRLWGNILTVEYARSFPKTSREMALRALNSTSQGPIWPPMGLISRPPLIARTRGSSYSSSRSRRSTRSRSRRRTRSRRHYSSETSTCYSSSDCSSYSSRSSSTRSDSYRRRSSTRPVSPRRGRRGRRGRVPRRDHTRSIRVRHSVSSYSSSNSRSRSPTGRRKAHTRTPLSDRRPSCCNGSIHSSHSGSEGEVTDFVEEDYEPYRAESHSPQHRQSPINGVYDQLEHGEDIPDSLVIEANLIRSPVHSSDSYYSASTQSSHGSKRRGRRKRRARCKRSDSVSSAAGSPITRDRYVARRSRSLYSRM